MSEPVEYQYRTRPDWIPEWNGWNTCSKESAEAYEKTPYLHDWHYEVRRLYTTPTAQQEPVAYIRVSKTGHVMACAKTGDFYKLPDKTLLYTSPLAQRPWVGLTDEEIDKTHETQVWDARRSYARAIEAKLKEKNT